VFIANTLLFPQVVTYGEGYLTKRLNNNLVSKRLLTRITASNSLQYHQQDEKNEKQDSSTKIELQFEIECPRCSDTMTLYSSFDTLYYFCEVCDFYLYTHANDTGQFR
jgi:hypothetical protein